MRHIKFLHLFVALFAALFFAVFFSAILSHFGTERASLAFKFSAPYCAIDNKVFRSVFSAEVPESASFLSDDTIIRFVPCEVLREPKTPVPVDGLPFWMFINKLRNAERISYRVHREGCGVFDQFLRTSGIPTLEAYRPLQSKISVKNDIGVVVQVCAFKKTIGDELFVLLGVFMGDQLVWIVRKTDVNQGVDASVSDIETAKFFETGISILNSSNIEGTAAAIGFEVRSHGGLWGLFAQILVFACGFVVSYRLVKRPR